MNNRGLESLEKRIQAIEDVAEIAKLKAEYAAVCDDHYNPSRAMELFTEDAVWDGGEVFGVHRGREAIRVLFERLLQTIESAVHYFVQPIIEVSREGDTARGKWYLWQACTLKGGAKMWVAGLEFDKYRKIQGKWLMSEMKLQTLLTVPHE